MKKAHLGMGLLFFFDQFFFPGLGYCGDAAVLLLSVFFCRAMRAASPRDICELVSGGVSVRVTSLTGAVTASEEPGAVEGFGAAFADATGAGVEDAAGRSNLASLTDTRDESETLLASSGFSWFDCNSYRPCSAAVRMSRPCPFMNPAAISSRMKYS